MQLNYCCRLLIRGPKYLATHMEQRMCSLWRVKQCLQCWSGYEWRGASDCVVLMKPETYLSKYHNCKWGRSEVDSAGSCAGRSPLYLPVCVHCQLRTTMNSHDYLTDDRITADILQTNWKINKIARKTYFCNPLINRRSCH